MPKQSGNLATLAAPDATKPLHLRGNVVVLQRLRIVLPERPHAYQLLAQHVGEVGGLVGLDLRAIGVGLVGNSQQVMDHPAVERCDGIKEGLICFSHDGTARDTSYCRAAQAV